VESLDLSQGRIVAESRPAYLLVTERGSLASVGDVRRYGAFVEAAASRTGATCLLVDARLGEPGERDDEVRAAFWAWLRSGRVFQQVAWVLPTEMAVTQANMQALSLRASLRAFSTAQEGHRWLLSRAGGFAPTLPALPAVRGESSEGPGADPPSGVPAVRAGLRAPSSGGVERVSAGARRPQRGGEERVRIQPRADVPLAPIADADAPRQSQTAVTTRLAAVRPSQRAIPVSELERHTPQRSDVVPRRTQPGVGREPAPALEGTGSDEDG
jgi:hypothetical protein